MREPQGFQFRGGGDGGGAGDFAQNGHFAHEGVAADLRHGQLAAAGQIYHHIRRALHHHIGGIANIALFTQVLTLLKCQPFRGEGQQLQLRGFDIGKHRDGAQQFNFLIQAHDRSPPNMPPFIIGPFLLGCQ